MSDVGLDQKELSTKVDEPNQTIGVLWFENNFLAEMTKKLEAELFQVMAQLERTSNAKINEMLSFQKSTSDKTGLEYDFSSSNIALFSTIVFVSSTDNDNSTNDEAKTQIVSENLDKGKSILEAPPKIEKKKKRLKTLGQKGKTTKILNKRSRISVITVEIQGILVQIATSG